MTEATEGHRCALSPWELEPEQLAETLARLRAQRASLALLEFDPALDEETFAALVALGLPLRLTCVLVSQLPLLVELAPRLLGLEVDHLRRAELLRLSAFTSLEHLALSGGTFDDQRLGELLASLPRLESLALLSTPVRGSFLCSLPPAAPLRALRLLEELPSPARGAPSSKPRYDLGALPALASLRDLELQGAAFDDEAVQPLLALAPLARLVLRKVSASAPVLASLRRAQPALVVTA